MEQFEKYGSCVIKVATTILIHFYFVAAIETVLEKTAGKFCVGDEVSIADVALIPQLYNANR